MSGKPANQELPRTMFSAGCANVGTTGKCGQIDVSQSQPPLPDI